MSAMQQKELSHATVYSYTTQLAIGANTAVAGHIHAVGIADTLLS